MDRDKHGLAQDGTAGLPDAQREGLALVGRECVLFRGLLIRQAQNGYFQCGG